MASSARPVGLALIAALLVGGALWVMFGPESPSDGGPVAVDPGDRPRAGRPGGKPARKPTGLRKKPLLRPPPRRSEGAERPAGPPPHEPPPSHAPGERPPPEAGPSAHGWR